jgi:hypothetical protein
MGYKVLLSLTIAVVTGCASTTPKYEISQDWDQAKLASVTIYRTNVFFHSGNPEKPFFYIDGMEVGKLGTGMAVTTKVTPGKHVISVHESLLFTPTYENGRIEYEFEAGKTYYVRYSKDFSGVAVTGSAAFPTGRTSFSFSDENSYQERK